MLADGAFSQKHWDVNLRVNPVVNLMLAILTVFWAQVPAPKRVVTLLTPTHLSFEKDNSFVVSQPLWMSEVTCGRCLDGMPN